MCELDMQYGISVLFKYFGIVSSKSRTFQTSVLQLYTVIVRLKEYIWMEASFFSS